MINSYEEFVKDYKDELEEVLNSKVDLDDFISDTVDLEINLYTTDLLDWYREDISRLYYVDSYMDEFGCHGQTIFNLLQGGQYEYLKEKVTEWVNKYISENQNKGE